MRVLQFSALAILTIVACSAPENNNSDIDAARQPAVSKPVVPKLVVIVTVDQMRNDFLDRHEVEFTGGFRRLLDDGLRFPNAWVDHAPTNSLPGHASIATGAHPKTHGFSDNSWKVREDAVWRRVYADDTLPHDCDANGHGGQGDGLSVATLGERIIEADGKFVSISASRNIARAYAGKARAPVLWLSPEDGGFTTNSCYAAELPDWAADFNRAALPDFVTGRWDLSLPGAVLATLRPDASDFEGEGESFTFPHIAPAEENDLAWFYDAPAADASALALALKAVEAESLGQDETPDIINVVINTIDNTGHRYGPFSVEQADNLFQLDKNLGAFMQQLDKIVGEGAWTLVLTGDHGAAPAPEALPDHPTARRVTEEEVVALIAAAHEAADQYGDNDPAGAQAAAEAVEAAEFVERVYVGDEILTAAASGDDTALVYANSFIADRPARHPFYDSEEKGLAELGLTVVLKEYVVVNWATSIHGSHYDYDRAVPIVFTGAGVRVGTSEALARTIDIAPTVMALIGLETDASIDGAALPLGRGR